MRIIWLIIALIGLSLAGSRLPYFSQPYELIYPSYWPEPSYNFKENPLTVGGVSLGRQLFYDPILSKDSTISCANCHLSYSAFTHVDHSLSHGIDDRIGTRNSLSLMNLAWNKSFMWDGSVHQLDMQAMAPITDQNEMGETLPNVLLKLQANTKYVALFAEEFGGEITIPKMLKAIAQFQLTLVSSNSKYDMVKTGTATFTEKEENGYKIFQQHCNSCHAEPLFTNNGFANNGLPIDSTLMDFGRFLITQNPLDSFKFKVPTLRNIQYSKPYMHDGRFNTLNAVINHYSKPKPNSSTMDSSLMHGLNLSSKEKVDITAFLLTLSDKEYIFNKKHAFPRSTLE